ncbi:MAG TPA: response regulator, partial [Ignavibacteriales bacterium]|nr:response regulator [Ignavibacteriales bacterium]
MATILVIEDDLDVRASITDLLREEGYSVYEADNGACGIRLAQSVRPDLIISDVLMPEKNGYEVLEELKKCQDFMNVPFIFLSARSSGIDVRNAMNNGADDYLFKPFKSNDLLSVIKIRLEKKSALEKKIEDLSNELALAFPYELHTPLTAILGYSQILQEEAGQLSAQETAEMSSRIEAAGNRLLQNIHKFLVYTELQAALIAPKKKLSDEREAESAEVIIKNAAVSIAEKYGRKEDLFMDVRDSSLKTPERFLSHAIEEIVENSFKYSDKNTAVKICSSSSDGMYKIIVEDAGWGMTP